MARSSRRRASSARLSIKSSITISADACWPSPVFIYSTPTDTRSLWSQSLISKITITLICLGIINLIDCACWRNLNTLIVLIQSKSTLTYTSCLLLIGDSIIWANSAWVAICIEDLIRISTDTCCLSCIRIWIARAASTVIIPPIISCNTVTFIYIPDLVGFATIITCVGEFIILFRNISAFTSIDIFIGKRTCWTFYAFLGIIDWVLVADTLICILIPNLISSAHIFSDTIDSISHKTLITEAKSVEVNLVGATSSQASTILKNDTFWAEIALTLPEISSSIITFIDQNTSLAAAGISTARDVSI